jgi:hypothetical protein
MVTCGFGWEVPALAPAGTASYVTRLTRAIQLKALDLDVAAITVAAAESDDWVEVLCTISSGNPSVADPVFQAPNVNAGHFAKPELSHLAGVILKLPLSTGKFTADHRHVHLEPNVLLPASTPLACYFKVAGAATLNVELQAILVYEPSLPLNT